MWQYSLPCVQRVTMNQTVRSDGMSYLNTSTHTFLSLIHKPCLTARFQRVLWRPSRSSSSRTRTAMASVSVGTFGRLVVWKPHVWWFLWPLCSPRWRSGRIFPRFSTSRCCAAGPRAELCSILCGKSVKSEQTAQWVHRWRIYFWSIAVISK